MKQLKDALKYVATAFLVLLVSLCIYTFVITDVLKKDYVNVFGYTYFVVATGSMSGTIEVDDIIFVKVTKEVRTNDVITFKNKDGDIITHRLITKSGDSYVTKGDVNNVADEPITKNQIIGKVTFVVSPSFILKSIAIFLIVFILLALVNFDNIIKKYIIRDTSERKVLPKVAVEELEVEELLPEEEEIKEIPKPVKKETPKPKEKKESKAKIITEKIKPSVVKEKLKPEVEKVKEMIKSKTKKVKKEEVKPVEKEVKVEVKEEKVEEKVVAKDEKQLEKETIKEIELEIEKELEKEKVDKKIEEKIEEQVEAKVKKIIDDIPSPAVVVEPYPVNKIPTEIFKNPKNRYEEPSSGLTVTFSLDEMELIQKIHEREMEREDRIEVLEDYDDKVFSYEPVKKKNQDKREKETVDFIVSLLKCKKSNETKARMNKKWLEKFQYIYRLCHLLLLDEVDGLSDDIEKPPFKEIYDYDLDKIGLTQSIRNRIYDMPIYVFLKILTYSILYNDDEMFDGVFKIMKYKAMIDKDKEFIQLDKYDKNSRKQVKTLIAFMQRISSKFDNKNVFELDRIERLAKIRKY